MPAAPRIGLIRWLRPSHVVTCPSFSRNAAAGKERVGVGLERAELERLDDRTLDVLQRLRGQRRIGIVAERVDTDQEQHVDVSRRARLQDAPPVPALIADDHRTPERLDLCALLREGEATAAGEELRVHARQERATVVGPPGHVCEPRTRLGRERTGVRNAERVVGQSRTGDHEAGIARLAKRVDHRLDLRPMTALFRLQQPRLVAGPAQDVLRDVVQPRPPRVQDEDLRPSPRGLAQPQVQDRDLLLRVQPRDQDDRGALDVVIGDRIGASGPTNPPTPVPSSRR